LKQTLPVVVSPGDAWVAYEPFSDTLMLASEADDSKGTPLVVIARATGEIIDKRSEEAGNLLVNPNKPLVYMSFFRRFGGVLAYDTQSRKIVADTATDARMDRMAFDPVNNELLIASPAESRIVHFDPDTLEPKGHFNSIFGVRVIAIDAERDVMLVASLASGEVAMMGLSDRTIKKTWYVGPWLRSIAIAQDRGVAYISSKDGLYELRYAGSD